jgi:hypothetical protein
VNASVAGARAAAPVIDLRRDSHGRLVLRRDGQDHVGVVPVRAFPLTAPQEGLSIVGAEGHELVWVDRLGDLDTAARALLEEELAHREFMPEIRALRAVSTFATPSTWTVETDRGETHFVLKGEEDIRRLGAGLLIASSHGVVFHVRELAALDRHSRRLFERFL